MVTVYLAHPRLELARGLELQKKIEALGIKVLNPFIRVEQPIYDKVISEGGTFTQEHVTAIVESDLRKVEEADMVIALVTGKASAGTHMEVFYASRILHRPVFCLYDFIREGQSVHPWYAYLTFTFNTEQSLLSALKTYMEMNQ